MSGMGFPGNLDEWVKMQKKMLEIFKDADSRLKDADRLDLIVASRAAFQHIIRTLKAFDQWLQDPVIISHLPREMLVDVWETTLKALQLILELDIRHTSGFRQHFEKLAKEGTLNPLVVWGKQGEGEDKKGKRVLPTTTI